MSKISKCIIALSCLILLVLGIYDAEAWDVEPGSTGNTLNLNVHNTNTIPLPDVTVTMTSKPSWITNFSPSSQNLGEISAGGTKTASCTFNVASGSENETGQIDFKVSSSGFEWTCLSALHISVHSLAVELSSFTATTIGDRQVILRWRTESETNNVGFTIYRGEEKDGKYNEVAFVNGAGNTGMPTDYQFTDKTIEPGKTYYYYLQDIDITGKKEKSKIVKVVVPPAKPALPIPTNFALLQNYPNPFNPETWIPFNLAKDAPVLISIYDTKGQLIRTIALGNKPAGIYTTKAKAAYWDGRDRLGEKVASGVYFYTLQAGSFRATQKMVIMK